MSFLVDITWLNKPFKLCEKQSSGMTPPEQVSCVEFSSLIFFMTTPIIFDFLPIGAILFFHKRNFTIKQHNNNGEFLNQVSTNSDPVSTSDQREIQSSIEQYLYNKLMRDDNDSNSKEGELYKQKGH